MLGGGRTCPNGFDAIGGSIFRRKGMHILNGHKVGQDGNTFANGLTDIKYLYLGVFRIFNPVHEPVKSMEVINQMDSRPKS